MLTRRSVLKLGGLLALQQACSVRPQPPTEEMSSFRLFEQGKWHAVICCAVQASAQVRTAATLLARYCQQCTGVPIAAVAKPSAEQVCIQIGAGVGEPPASEVLRGLDADGFVIDFPDNRTVRILGVTDWGTEFGVYEFLERYLGVRWLLPGPQGEYVPQLQTLTLMPELVRQQPVFTSRLLSGLRGEEQVTWARRQRQHGRIEFHDNLRNLFPPEQYTKTHPHFFPLRDGKRYLPPTNTSPAWQPCFSAHGLVDEAVKNICAYFARHPNATSYSLAVNDGHGYCECDLCTGGDEKRRNALGLVDASRAYFA
ncbi:MAG: DUF4838 domain-containing protein [Deltaproteobacteria bacterium]|nr:DUF4838 domain-containing protein [Deltaproteobacteria bacterium]